MSTSFPSGRDLPGSLGVIGQEVKTDDSRIGFVDDGNLAWPERITEARRQWPQASLADFEFLGKRLWRDRATGIEYREARGAPLLSIGTDANRLITTFFISQGRLVFMERTDVPAATVIHHGPVRGGQVIDGRLVWSS
jgi:hypothetical protein